ncbi:reverse transcriptase [Phytophthora megakarya]|uniref:Reverse transcriptase n=1 Tax=Phytophthora megakarya TaxID=4795 RepID=A0A225VSZ7_9STRA|nr:reverse transcriptase [Phytophthora megakarya]
MDITWDSDQDYDEFPATTDDVRIEDIQLCGSNNQTPEEIDRLRQRIWKFRHLLIGKGNALPPAARGVVCDIDAGGVRPIVLKCRALRIQFRVKLAALIKGLLLTQLMVYLMPLINDVPEDLVSTLWHCSLDMASGFWVVKMTDWARLISDFVNPIWTFRYRFTWIPKMAGDLEHLDVFENLRIRVNPKDLSALTDLEFPGSLRAMQSFLGCLNYYSRFIEEHAIYASVLYELREIDYAAMRKGMNRSRIQLALASESPDPDMLTKDSASPRHSYPDPRSPDPELSEQNPNLVAQDPMHDCGKVSNPEKDILADLDPRWIHGYRSFKVLKEKIAKTPILALRFGSTSCVMFASRTLKFNELNYGIAEKEVLALLRILDLNYNTLVGRPIRVLTRYSTLASLLRSNALQGRLSQWVAQRSPWILEMVKCNKGEDEVLSTLAARIPP